MTVDPVPLNDYPALMNIRHKTLGSPSARYAYLKMKLRRIERAILATLLFPNELFNFSFLRALRLRAIGDSPLPNVLLTRAGCSADLDVAHACLNFLVFLFMVTGFVYTTFFYNRDGLVGFVDALYFTIATMTMTGFGDILPFRARSANSSQSLHDLWNSLFVRLAQTIVRDYKGLHPRPQCDLQRHDQHAVHFKACGHLLNIPNNKD